jgi:protein-S-isoprenylcysteine O-methyltransferase Ste14
LLVEIGLHFLLPLWRVIPAPWNWSGLLVFAAGLGLGGSAAGQFLRVRTPLPPFQVPTALVTGGMFRITRNPMYLSMVMILAGTAVVCGTPTPFVVPPLFMWTIATRFIRHEERVMEALFGSEYTDYKRRVRRWL